MLRRLARVFFTVCAVTSLLLFLAVVARFTRLWRGDDGFAVAGTRHVQFAVLVLDRQGIVRVSFVPWPLTAQRFIERRDKMFVASDPSDPSAPGDAVLGGSPSRSTTLTLLGVSVARRAYPYTPLSGGPPYHNVEFTAWLPYPALLVVLCLPPTVWAVAARRRRARARHLAQGRCRSCGYDLRASPERCPECGAAVSRASSSPSRGR